jgi:hypothetical protein
LELGRLRELADAGFEPRRVGDAVDHRQAWIERELFDRREVVDARAEHDPKRGEVHVALEVDRRQHAGEAVALRGRLAVRGHALRRGLTRIAFALPDARAFVIHFARQHVHVEAADQAHAIGQARAPLTAQVDLGAGQRKVERLTCTEGDVVRADSKVDVLIDPRAQLARPGRMRVVELRAEIELAAQSGIVIRRAREQELEAVAASVDDQAQLVLVVRPVCRLDLVVVIDRGRERIDVGRIERASEHDVEPRAPNTRCKLPVRRDRPLQQ